MATNNSDAVVEDDENAIEEVDDAENRPLLQSRTGNTQVLESRMSSMQPKVTSQLLTAIAATLGAMAMGTVLGYSSPAGPILLAGNDGLNLSESQNNWASSISNVGAAVGGPLAGFAIGAFGRKLTMIMSVVPYLAGWLFIVFAQNFSMLLIGRIICGLCMGITSLTVPTYIGEFSSANIRGALSTGFQLMVTIGILYAYAMGPAFDSFRWIAAVCIVPAVLHSTSIIFTKESPSYLFIRGKDEQAKDALQFFRGEHYDISKEAQSLKESVQEVKENSASLADFKKPYILKPLLIVMGLMVFQQVSGINAVLFNLSIIFRDAGTTLDDDVCSIIVGIVMVVSTGVSSMLIDRLGRKILLIVSSIFMSVSLIALGAYFYLKDQAGDDVDALQDLADNLGWLPLVSLIIFIIAFSIGYGPIPWIMMGEMFSADVRELAASIATVSNWSLSFLVTLSFGPIKSSIGSHGAYWLFGSICVVNFFFSALIVQETKGKTLEQISALFGAPAQKLQQKPPVVEKTA